VAINFLAKQTRTAEIVYLADVCVGGEACAASILGQAGDWPAVGGTFFRNFLTTFDFHNNELILGPHGSAWTPPMNALQRLGLQLHILDAGDVVWVEPGSPAEKAGIAAGATLEMIDGQAVRDLGFLGVHEVLEDPAKDRFGLTFRASGGPRRTVRVTVRRPRGRRPRLARPIPGWRARSRPVVGGAPSSRRARVRRSASSPPRYRVRVAPRQPICQRRIIHP
jgi:hypothetical protein